MKVTGTIIRRRSMGKHLAFADIEVVDLHHRNDYEDEDEDQGHVIEGDNNRGDIIHIAFRRASPLWDKARDDTFPTKNALLPYGAKLSLQLCKREDKTHIDTALSSNGHEMTHDNQAGKKKASCWEVSSWEIITHPHKIAIDHARKQISTDYNTLNNDGHPENGGILCTAYLKSRADNFFGYHQNLPPKQKHKSKQPREILDNNCWNENNDDSNDNIKINYEKKISLDIGPPSSSYELQESHGGDKRSKALRAKIFASWLLEKFGSDLLKKDGTNGVLDIAGGKGQLSIELSILAQVRCTIIDPQVRGKGGPKTTCFSSKDMKRMKKNESPIPVHIAKCFVLDKEKEGENSMWVCNSSCLVGLHPDECTEDILDAALHYKKSFAIVPCCVFPTFFPTRRLRCGKVVRTYDEFLLYLLEKDDRLNREALPFEGKNQVIYYHEETTKTLNNICPPTEQS